MAERKIKQIVYFCDNAFKNYPQSDNNESNLIKSVNEITKIKNGIIERLAIQNYSNLSGILYFRSIADMDNYSGNRLIRPYEIYEISFKELPVLKDFYFEQNFIRGIKDNINNYLIIDVIYKV